MKMLLALGLGVTVPASLVMGDLIFYDNQAAFEAAMAGAGKTLKFVETFEENTWPDGDVTALDPILTHGIPNGPFENGIDALNLTVTTDGEFLVLLTAGFLGNPSDIVGPNTFTANGMLIFDGDDKTGIGMDLWVLSGNVGSMQIDVFDPAGVLIGSAAVLTPGDLTYFAVQSTGGDIIGSIMTSDPISGAAGELYDNIAMYTIPAPGALALLGLAGLAGRRRRRLE